MTASRMDDRRGREPSFSIYEFKSWFEKQSDFNLQAPNFDNIYAKEKLGDLTGTKIESRLGQKRLEAEIAKHNEELSESKVIVLAKSFKDNGGVIIETLEGMKVTVETQRGSFVLPNTYTKALS